MALAVTSAVAMRKEHAMHPRVDGETKRRSHMADDKRSFDPSQTGVNRGREQGLGMGQRELDRQRDPEQLPQTAITDNPEEDWGEPADEGVAYSTNHTTRGEKTDAERGPGPKTRQASKDAISRRS
jgi:hypothetical protein